VCVCVCLLQTW